MSNVNSEPSPPGKAAAQPPPAAVRIGRVQIALNVLVQICAVFTLVVMANYLSFRHHKTFDWSATGKYSLSEQTLGVLKQLEEPCTAYVFYANTSDRELAGAYSEIYQESIKLLHEYESQTNRKLVLVVVDVGVDPTRGKELQTKYSMEGSENQIVLDYKGKVRTIEMSHMADMDKLPEVYQRPDEGVFYKITAFKGEQYITGALISLWEEKSSKVYVVYGHGEFSLGNPNFQEVAATLQQQNLRAEDLSLISVERIPKDAAAVLIAKPERDFSERDLKLLSDYWAQNGRIFLAIGPEVHAEKLNEWLRARGIIMRGDQVIFLEKESEKKLNVNPATGFMSNLSKISRKGAGDQVGFPMQTQSIMPVEAMFNAHEIDFRPLVLAQSPWYGETDPIPPGGQPYFDPAKDNKPPLFLAVSLEKGALRDPTVQLETPRLVVVGNGVFLSDGILKNPKLEPDKRLVMNSINWLTDRESLINVAPKDRTANNVHLTDEKILRLGALLIIVVPVCFALLGLYYIFWRHGRNLLTLTACILAVLLFVWGLLAYIRSRNEANAPASAAAIPSSP